MLLSFDEIKSITKGALHFKEENGYLYPRRCTDKQTAVWYTEEEVRGRRSKMSAGVRLDFLTSSAAIKIEYLPGCHFSLLIDGIFVSRADGAGSFEYALPDGKKRITVVFHYDEIAAIKSIELNDDATYEPISRDKKFLFLGDSITQGYHTEFEFINYPYLVSEHFDADFLNQAIGGGDFYLPTLDNDVDYSPDAVFIAFGANDWSHFATLDILRQRCQDYLDGIIRLYGGKKIFGITPLWRADENAGRAMGSFAECIDLIKEEFISHGITVIDGYKLVPHSPSFFIDKYLHPYTLGFSQYAKNLIKEISTYL